MAGVLDTLSNIVGGGLFKEAKDLITEYWPPDIPPEKKLELEMALQQAEFAKEIELGRQFNEQTAQLNQRITDLEGTAADLKGIPFLGPLMLFIRGSLRPAWGVGAMYADMMWFSGKWAALTEQQEAALYLINMLVLGFLFGERAVQNIAPILGDVFTKARGQNSGVNSTKK
uniref:Coil containing protein n=1 Tax=Pseudomonas phage Cygsa01 TaxID=3138529 RepID=A0AAU6W3N8_9VIRU